MTLSSFEKRIGTRYTLTADADLSTWEPMDRCGDESPAVWMPLEIHAFDNERNKAIYVYNLDVAFSADDSEPDFRGDYEWLIDPETLSKGVQFMHERTSFIFASEIAAALVPSARKALEKYSKEA